jgi:hypothetical protein
VVVVAVVVVVVMAEAAAVVVNGEISNVGGVMDMRTRAARMRSRGIRWALAESSSRGVVAISDGWL